MLFFTHITGHKAAWIHIRVHPSSWKWLPSRISVDVPVLLIETGRLILSVFYLQSPLLVMVKYNCNCEMFTFSTANSLCSRWTLNLDCSPLRPAGGTSRSGHLVPPSRHSCDSCLLGYEVDYLKCLHICIISSSTVSFSHLKCTINNLNSPFIFMHENILNKNLFLLFVIFSIPTWKTADWKCNCCFDGIKCLIVRNPYFTVSLLPEQFLNQAAIYTSILPGTELKWGKCLASDNLWLFHYPDISLPSAWVF